MEKISVIIPIYNSEKYLKRCLDSVRRLTYTDFEVLLINDGSTDGSENICKQYCDADKRFILISTENGGVSRARNLGVKKARGKFIVFIDSDDFIEPQFLSAFMNAYTCSHMPICSYVKIFEGKKERQFFKLTDINGTTVRLALANCNALLDSHLLSSVCNKLYEREKITNNGISFRGDLDFGEDLHFNFDYILKSGYKGFIYIPDYNYNYIVNSPFSNSSRKYSNYVKLMLGQLDAGINILKYCGCGTNEIIKTKLNYFNSILYRLSVGYSRKEMLKGIRDPDFKALTGELREKEMIPQKLSRKIYKGAITLLRLKNRLWIR